MPPVRAADCQREAGDHGDAERGQAAHAEHVDPGGDVGGLAIGQQFAGRQDPGGETADPVGPHAGVLVGAGRSGLPVRASGTCLVWDRRVSAAFGEGQQQRGAKDHHHDRDKAEIGDRHGED